MTSLYVGITDCGTLLDPPNGQVDLTGTGDGSEATYTCSEGYVLIGTEVRTCQSNGNWSSEEPLCECEWE